MNFYSQVAIVNFNQAYRNVGFFNVCLLHNIYNSIYFNKSNGGSEMLEVNLVSFEDDLANFEIRNNGEMVSCHAHIGINSLHDFLDGDFIIEPYAWFDMNGDHIGKPEWFKRKELNLLNDAFEIGYKEICEKMIDDQGGL